jgi:general secretion pathway protein F/MSHA biogenesis protein MshG
MSATKYFKITYVYKGKTFSKIINATNKAEAISEAKKVVKGLVVKVQEVPMPLEEKLKLAKDWIQNKIFRKKMKYPAYIAALNQLAVMIKAGISLKDALEDIGKHSEDELVKELFLHAAEAIDTGKSLTDAFKDYEQYVGGLSVAMIRLGEQTGDLVMAIESLAKIYDNIYQNRRKMVKALRYPIITLIAIAVAFVFLIMLVVPKFKAMFEQLHAELPLPTRILLFLEYLFSHYGPIVLLVIILIAMTINLAYKISPKFKYKMDALMLKTYLINKIILYATLHRFLLILSSLLKSGIPLLDALKISEGIIENEVIKAKVREIIRGINQGRNMAEVMEEVELVDFIALRMISAGEESGELDTMLSSAAKYYEEKFQDVIENMQAAIEPIMLTVIGGLVLLIALGIFLPMWDLANAAKNA